MQCKKQQYEAKRSWWKDLKIKGLFIFPIQRCSIGKRLQNGFNGKIQEFSSTLQKIVSVCRIEHVKNNQVGAQHHLGTNI